ncbi:hypothetical protein [Limoniibacter endophyticus]|uniref:Uncharacterized protein n=1 Tax=Limoniibacter endophyticus TaxID=1565040 RepID=A0A8J3GHI3_9HYPH|nr:hypothetical protein [Limoniibacter endophyticus]GHC79354.1 hypothetical protein GCM10010136_31830 [Limoniibacter endophyticus]
MIIKQRWTLFGYLGIVFVFAGPALAGYGYLQIADAVSATLTNPYSAQYLNVRTSYWMIGAGGIMSLASLPMMLIGRSLETEPDEFTTHAPGGRDPNF